MQISPILTTSGWNGAFQVAISPTPCVARRSALLVVVVVVIGPRRVPVGTILVALPAAMTTAVALSSASYMPITCSA
jgi:hypothetical protein